MEGIPRDQAKFDRGLAEFLAAPSQIRAIRFVEVHPQPANERAESIREAIRLWTVGCPRQALAELDDFLAEDVAVQTLAGRIGWEFCPQEHPLRRLQATTRLKKAALAEYAPAQLAMAQTLAAKKRVLAAYWWAEQAARQGNPQARVWIRVVRVGGAENLVDVLGLDSGEFLIRLYQAALDRGCRENTRRACLRLAADGGLFEAQLLAAQIFAMHDRDRTMLWHLRAEAQAMDHETLILDKPTKLPAPTDMQPDKILACD